MRRSTNFKIMGTQYYKATELFRQDSLVPNIAVRLEHQPNNPHDKNAVAVKLKETGAMLGHLSRELAPKYAELINSGKVIEAKITNVKKIGHI